MNSAGITSKNSVRIVGRFAFTSAVLVAVLIVYGSWVRASGAGLGCPDWPLCKGVLIPGLEGDTLVEFGHRVLAGFTMLMVFLTTYHAWRRRSVDRFLAKLLSFASIFIFIQAGLGGLTVLTELDGFVRLAHLFLALSILGLLTASSIRAFDIRGTSSPGFLNASLLLFVAVIVTLSGGGIVASGVSSGCPAFIFCDDRSTLYIAVQHNLHRGAGVALILTLITTGILMIKAKRGKISAPTKLATFLNHGAALLVLIQGYVGISIVSDGASNELLRVLHLGIAMLIMWALISLWVLVIRTRQL